MKTQVKELPENRVRLDVEVPAADVDHAFEHAIGDIARTIRIPGFRKGRAPAQMVRRAVSRETLVEEALRDHLTGWYSRAVAVAGIDPVERPTIDWSDEPVEGAPFHFFAEVEVKPEPQVRAYKGLEAVRPPDEVPPEAVEAELERLQRSVASLNPVDRPAAAGDYVVVDFHGTVDGKAFAGADGVDHGVLLGESELDDFDRALTGLSAGEERDADIAIPKDYDDETAAGKTATFHVRMKEVKERDLPALDDDFAQSVSEFDTLEDLRADIVERFSQALRERADVAFRTAVLGALAGELSTEVPKALVDIRLREMVRNLSGRLAARGVSLEDYLRVTGARPEELVAQIEPEALDSVRRDLALEAVAIAEKIDVSDERLEQWVRDQAGEEGENPDESVEDLLGDPATRTALRTDLRMQAALDVVVEHATPITAEQAEARDKLWTPEKESAAASGKPSPIWTPGSGEPANR
jgi:trigger factor